MSDSVSSVDDFSMDAINENILIDIDDLDGTNTDHHSSITLDSRRRLERCLEERRLAKDLREFDFDL